MESKIARIEHLEQYSIRVSGIKESELGEDLTNVVIRVAVSILATINPEMPQLTMADVNGAHHI